MKLAKRNPAVERHSIDERRYRRSSLKSLLADLQKTIRDVGLTPDKVKTAIEQLRAIDARYEYNDEKFPPLGETGAWNFTMSESPRNLSEALIWKLGKWKAYREFVLSYVDEASIPDAQSVVFDAFAKHLKNRTNPIYDQHSLRAIWSISPYMKPGEAAKCKRWLVSKKGKWKAAGAGPTATDCYEIFKDQLRQIAHDPIVSKQLDRLLMPLGQAIKQLAPTYNAFVRLLR
jgi:hypothetical protein